MTLMTLVRLIVLLTLVSMGCGRAAASSAEAAWAALTAGGVYAISRHALAPGTGDPTAFRIDDCATQRNLDGEGRSQARRLGTAIRERGIRVDGVYTSQWCRCRDTARLLDLAPVDDLPALNSFFQRWERREPQMTALRAWLRDRGDPEGAVFLITHQVNVTALTGVFPASGETVVFRTDPDGGITVVGRIPPP